MTTPTDSWVVESDYLHPEGSDASHEGVAYLLSHDQRQRLGGRAPFRYLGRKVRVADWNPVDPHAEYLNDVTAVGWGHPSFHAFYPNSWSVFGFHDPDTQPGTDPTDGFEYRVYGFYSHDSKGPLAAFEQTNDAELRSLLDERFEWQVDDFSGRRPSRVLCVGAVTVTDPSSSDIDLKSVTVANTGAEALSALIARTQPEEGVTRPQHEEALESIVIGSRLDPDRPDAYAKLREACHDKAFDAVHGGWVWSIRAEGSGLPADSAHGPRAGHGTSPTEPAQLMVALNQVQHELDRATRQQTTLRAQLYSDWCKYQKCKYPPRGSDEDYPDADEVRRHIEITGLAELEANISTTNRVAATASATSLQAASLLHEHDLNALRFTADDVVDRKALAAGGNAGRFARPSTRGRSARGRRRLALACTGEAQ